ncbi:ABC transporter permease [Bradyrhizobium arachidis]|uniref:ABC transporter permease n=1 Tax=Bradyrhizobium arachidis TaxID=858423 RepID=UPI0021639427|nr:ABC transporter permease [Bradyrhizobium arachidis]UVO30465.1 ABC transporter permease [Bradyrhizobium arachidis]
MTDIIGRRELVGFLGPVTSLMAFGLLLPLAFITYNSLGGEHLSLKAYTELFNSALFLKVTWTTIQISFSAALLSVVLAYPIALHLSRVSDRWRPLFMVLVLLPFWTSILVKSYSFVVVLGEHGLVNNGLVALGLPRLPLMFNRVGVLVGMTNYLVPFVVFPLLANLLGQSLELRRAAAVMGASDLRIFWQVTFPLSLPGLLAGGIMCFVISLGSFVTPALLGGRHDMMVANLIDFYTRESLDWSVASAIAVLLFAAGGTLLLLLGKVQGSKSLI